MNQEVSPRKILESRTTYDDHFRPFNHKISIKDKIKFLCLQESNNYFIGQPISSLEQIESNIKPIKMVPEDFRKTNKWKCQMNKKLNFVWKNIDESFCKDFKEQLGSFKSVAAAYKSAIKINCQNNPEYNSKKSTSKGFRERATSSISNSTPSTLSSTNEVTGDSKKCVEEKESELKNEKEHLERFKHDARMEVVENLHKIEHLCKTSKKDLLKKLTSQIEDFDDSFDWAGEAMGNKDPNSLNLEKLLTWHILAHYHKIIEQITCGKLFDNSK